VAAPAIESRAATEAAQTGWSIRQDCLSETFANYFQHQFDVLMYRAVFQSDDPYSLLL
jgi:hypothetical protein